MERDASEEKTRSRDRDIVRACELGLGSERANGEPESSSGTVGMGNGLVHTKIDSKSFSVG